MKKTAVVLVSCVALLTAATLTVKASGNRNYEFSQDGRFVRSVNPSTGITPAADTKYKVIAGDLSAYPLAPFFSDFGNTVAEGGSNYPFQTWVAVPFTPAANATVAGAQVPVGRLGSGTSGFEVGIYNDASGLPGTVTQSVHFAGSKVPNYGQCCVLDTVAFSGGIPVTAGTQYWLAVTTTSSDTDIYGWNFNTTNMSPAQMASWCSGSTTYCGSNNNEWSPYSYTELAFRVLGN